MTAWSRRRSTRSARCTSGSPLIFAEVRPLFEEELRRLEHLDEKPERWETAYRRIREIVRLVAPDGRPVPEFLVHIEGEDAWWRWGDEPFPQREDEP